MEENSKKYQDETNEEFGKMEMEKQERTLEERWLSFKDILINRENKRNT